MRPLASLIFVAGLTLTVAADAPRAPRPPQAPEPPPIQHQGHRWTWDEALEKYRPDGQGWYWSESVRAWCRDVPAPGQYHAPAAARQPPQFYGAPPMMGGNCAGGQCSPAPAGPLRRR